MAGRGRERASFCSHFGPEPESACEEFASLLDDSGPPHG